MFASICKAALNLIMGSNAFKRLLPPLRPAAASADYFRCSLMTDVLQTAPFKERRKLATKERIVPSFGPPFATLPSVLVATIERMSRIYRRYKAPVSILVDQPPTWSKELHHPPDRYLLPAQEPE